MTQENTLSGGSVCSCLTFGLKNAWTRMIPAGVLKWKGSLGASTLDRETKKQNYRQLRNAENRRNSFLREELPNWLFSTKWSALKWYTYVKHVHTNNFAQTEQVEIYLEISEMKEKGAINLKENKRPLSERGWREEGKCHFILISKSKKDFKEKGCCMFSNQKLTLQPFLWVGVRKHRHWEGRRVLERPSL